jgi:FKBP-type peptidyl-prolyl cis-trans isomerase
MKLSSIRPYRRLIFAGMLFVVLSFGTISSPFFSSARAASTNAAPAAASAPAGANIDKDTGKPIVTTPSGLKYVDLVVGTGPDVKTGDHVQVKYVGKLMDGTVFDASERHPEMGPGLSYEQGVTELIAGWTEGTSTMKVGGKRKLIIPPQLGYGMQGQGDVIPPNATLIFEVEMLSDTDAKPTAK